LTETNLTELIPISIEEEMKRSYLDYAMSVIVSRAIPDVRDGLKPVHRRILYAMNESGCDWNKPFRKSARIVGEVMGKYHPHGDSAIYDSLVRMAQSFSLRLPLIDGQGNFGSMDGDSPAAMRYTESRLAKSAHSILDDIDKDTVDFQENYDGSEQEPLVLPARFPNLLVNGAGGIAVGMATNIPPHNLGELIDACCLYIDDNDVTMDQLMEVVLGPDFPTGGIILGKNGIRNAILTGRGSVIIRGRAEIENFKENRQAIIITEVPYQVNKAKMVERIAELVRDKKIEGISDLRDESDKSGVRVVVEVKRDAMAEVILNQLYSYTPLQVSFGVNTLALNNGRPQVMNLKDVLVAFIKFREIVITRRTNYLLTKARDRAHILIGLSIAVANIDEVIALIKAAPDPNTARERLMNKAWSADDVRSLIDLVADDSNNIENGKCFFTEAQAKAILEMRLQRLTGLEHEKINQELQELAAEIVDYMEILNSRTRLLKDLKRELIEIKEQFATPRKTEIQMSEFEYDIEDLIQKDEMVVTVTASGYIKRVPLSTYRAQKRGGKGRSGITMHDEDIITELFVTNTHVPLMFFSNLGQVYKLKVYKLPLGTPQAKGRALVNIFPLKEGEKITTLMPLPEDENLWENLHIMFATANGNARRNDLSDFHNIPSNGKIAIRMEADDRLVEVALCKDSDHILLASYKGKCVRFPVTAIRVFKSRTSDGVRGMRLSKEDKVISMSVLHGAGETSEIREAYLKIPLEIRTSISMDENSNLEELLSGIETTLTPDKIIQLAKSEEFILTITENGYGKRSSAYEYRVTNRGGQGIVNIITSERNGGVINSFPVNQNDQIMLMSDKGTLIRCPVSGIRIAGRNTQGVVLFRTSKDEKVVSTARILEGLINDDAEASDVEGTDDLVIDNVSEITTEIIEGNETQGNDDV
jgi:DNA gyrase subunit A